MLPKIEQALVVEVGHSGVETIGYWAKHDGDMDALLRFAQLAANSPSERFVQRGDQDYCASPLATKGAPKQFVVWPHPTLPKPKPEIRWPNF